MNTATDYFRTICRVSRAFGSALDRDELLHLVVASAIDTMRGKAACLFLEDPSQDIFLPVAQKGLSERYLHTPPGKARPLVDELLQHGHIAVRDAAGDPRSSHPEAKRQEGIASYLVVPVRDGRRVIGVLTLYTADPRDFDADEIAFLTALAEQGGMAIERGRLVGQLRRNAKLFHDLAAGINGTLDVRAIMEKLSRGLTEALGVKGATIRLLDEDRNTLRLVASFGLSEEFLNKGPVFADRSVSQSLKGETVLIPDASRDTRVQYPEAMRAEGIVSILSTPIRARDRVIGVLKLFTGAPREFHEDELTMVRALAHQGGLAIQNASVHMLLQQEMKELKDDIWSHRSWF